ncbi:pleiotropic drug resistance protein 1-like isoform X2 [Herrania umbratica]|nr:pleiotropic drug resistance protein 1-like isoform X2 [Herrania umbratica]
MTLLLGPPSSGKTTLLLALAGMLDQDLRFSGRVTYNGHDMREFVPQKSAAYISQVDLHIPEMTVRETLAFSARCQGVGSQYDMLMELLRREKASNIKPDPDIDIFMKAAATEGQEMSIIVDYVLKILGLEVCADTLVGDAMLRGISGGQKKRLTTGEMLVGPAKVLLMDEISTGLDSSTTFQVVNAIKRYVNILDGTALISLLQPPPETYDLFDDILLLSDGQIVYQGPREFVLEFFGSMGFKCPERKEVADFLQEVTSRKDQEQYWANKDESYDYVTAKTFAEAFRSFHIGLKLMVELQTPFDKSKSHRAALTTKKYGARKKELVKACISRELLLMKRNSFVIKFKLMQISGLAFIVMTVFLRTEMHRNSISDGGMFMGSLCFLLYQMLFNGFSEMGMVIAKLPVFYKQRALLFYPPWAYALPSWFLRIPITVIEVAVFVVPIYYVIGYDPNIGRFFRLYLQLLLMKVMASAWFRFLGAVGRTAIVGNTFGALALMTIFIFGGYMLSRENVKRWWIWLYWLSPAMYAQNALAVNEFLGNSWKHPVYPNSTKPIGVAVLEARGMFPHSYWYWLGIGATIGFTLLFNCLFTIALTYLKPIEKRESFISEESLKSRWVDDIGATIELPHQGRRPVGGTESAERGIGMIRRVSSAITLTTTGTNSEVHQSQPKRRGMILPFELHSITFDEIRYFINMPQEMKEQGINEDRLELLKGVSGTFRPGVLTALMGVSGAGKTTLMDVLAGRKTGGYIEGTITVSGYTKKQETFARIFGYCEQNDIHSPYVTVYESLVYSAWLRLPLEVDSETRKIFVEEVMELVELSSLREALVGLPGVNGLSLEQRRRLTVAVELMSNPSIIFMDEPTSGLDARAAAIVMRTVRNTVDTGRTVVCTIHQPSIDIFESFDELYLMTRGGQEIYVGPLGQHSCHLIKYFEGIEGVGKIKDGYNPATWVLEVTTSVQADLGVNFNDVYHNSELYRRNKALIKELSTPSPGSKDLYFVTKYSQPFFIQFKACLWKQYCSYWRNTSYTAFRLFFTAFVALLFGSMFWDLGTKWKRQQDLFNAMGAMYISVIFIGVNNTFSVMPIIAVERTVFYRERAAGMYSPMAYALAQAMIELPYLFVQAVVFGVIIYAMIGFQWHAAKFFWYMFIMYFNLSGYTFYGMMVVALTPNQQVAYIVSTAVYGLWSLFAGFLIPRPRIPVWWRWYYWACPLAWTLYGLIASQFGDVKDRLDTNETVQSFIRSYYGFRHDFLGVVAAVMVAFPAFYALTFAFSIKVLNFQKR